MKLEIVSHLLLFFLGGGWVLGCLFELGRLKSYFWGWGGGGECLFEAGSLLAFSTFRLGAYSRWVLTQINTVSPLWNDLTNQISAKGERKSFSVA